MTRGALPLFVLLALAPACRQADSVVFVNVSMTEPAEVSAIRVFLSMADARDTRIFAAKSEGQAIRFPSSLTLVVPRSRSGRLDLVLDGQDRMGNSIAHGTGQTTIVVGGQVSTSVELSPGSLCGNGVVSVGGECHFEPATADAAVPDGAVTSAVDGSTLADLRPDIPSSSTADAQSPIDCRHRSPGVPLSPKSPVPRSPPGGAEAELRVDRPRDRDAGPCRRGDATVRGCRVLPEQAERVRL